MRRILATFVSCTLAALAPAVDAPVLAQFTIPDGARLVQHFQAGVIGRLWNDAALLPLRAKLDEVLPMAEAELGFSPLALPESLSVLQATLFGLPAGASAEESAAYKKSPDFSLHMGLGKLAVQIFAKLKEQGDPVVVPGTAEAITFPGSNATLVRIGEMLLMGSSAKRLIPSPIAPSDHDLTFRFNGHFIADTMRSGMSPAEFQKADGVLQALHRFLVPVTAHVDIAPTHIASHFEAKTSLPFLTPVDLALCDRLPATAYSVNALGFDGAVLWTDLIAPLIAVSAANQGMTPEALVQPADQRLSDFGATTTFKELVGGLRGTLVFAQSPGAPFPGYTVAIPRSPGLDQVVGLLLKQLGNELPNEGEALPLAFPNLPLPVNLVRDRGHWVISTDTALATTWATTIDGGWLTSPLGKLATEKAGKTALMVAASDAAAELRSMQGYIGMGLGALPMEPKEKQAVMRAFSLLIANAGLGYEVMQQRGDLLVSEGQSMLGGSSTSIAVVAIIAAIAIPNLLESRVTANEAAATASLKSGVFPALVQFQAGGYRDLDGDNIGEYGFFHEMAGGAVAGRPAALPKIQLLAPAERWNHTQPEVNGYRFALYLPDGKGGAYGAEDEAPKGAEAITASERQFVVYAWPLSSDTGRKAFALTNAGMVLSIPARELDGEPPAWNAVFGGEGKGWNDEPVWGSTQRTQQKNGAPAREPEASPF